MLITNFCAVLKLYHFGQTARQPITKVLLQVGQDVGAIGCSPLSAAVPADEQSQAKVLIFNF